MSNPDPVSSLIDLPISSLARHTAQRFANEQITLHKARRTFLNTLSVWVVHDYLALMGIDTNLNQGDSWNPFMRHWGDVADLVISGIGCLECRPLLKSTVKCFIPPEAWQERIAYIFVEIDPSYAKATLVGFLSQAQMEVSIDILQPIDDLLACLYQLKQSSSLLTDKYVLLRDWLAGRYTEHWLDMPELLAHVKPVTFRWQSKGFISALESKLLPEGASRGKFYSLGLHLIPLAIQIEKSLPNRFDVTVRVFPESGSYLIPEGLILTVLDVGGKIVLQTQARSQDGILQLRFSGSIGEFFQVRLSLDDLWVIQTYMI
jgi:Protein of unknown function (DUF1822)